MLDSEGKRTIDYKLETTENCLHAFCIDLQETSLISNIPNITAEEAVSIASGEGHKPVYLLTDKFCEELAHSYLFPMSKFCYKAEGILYLNAMKYFDHEYLNIHKNLHQTRLQFFAHSILQQLNIDSHIKMIMRKTMTSNLTADMPTQNFEAVHQFTASNEVKFSTL